MKNPITLLPPDKFRVVKVISIEGPSWNSFTGYLIYKRVLSEKFNTNTPDFLDEIIQKTIEDKYPGSRLELAQDLFFEGQYQDILKSYLGGTSINFEIAFVPSIPLEQAPALVGKEFPSYLLRLPVNLLLGPNHGKIEFIQKDFLAYLEYNRYNELHIAYNSFDFS